MTRGLDLGARCALIAFITAASGCGAPAPRAGSPSAGDSTTLPPRAHAEARAAPRAAEAPPAPTAVATAPEAAAIAEDEVVAEPSRVIGAMPERCDVMRFAMRGGHFVRPDFDALVARTAEATGTIFPAPRPKRDPRGPPGLANGNAILILERIARAMAVVSLALQSDEIAMCSNREASEDVVALAVELTRAKDPAGAFAAALRARTGRRPLRRDLGGVTYLQATSAGGWIAVQRTGRVVLASSLESAVAAMGRDWGGPKEVKGSGSGSDAAGFAAALRSALWIKTDTGAEVRVRDAGERCALTFRHVATDADEAQRAAHDLESLRVRADELPVHEPAFAPLVPALRATRVVVRGTVVEASTTAARSACVETMGNLQAFGSWVSGPGSDRP